MKKKPIEVEKGEFISGITFRGIPYVYVGKDTRSIVIIREGVNDVHHFFISKKKPCKK